VKINEDQSDLLFRLLFCLIFVGLGAEHLFSDQLIQKLIPDWLPMKRLVSIGCGLWLCGWGSLIMVGWRVKQAAIALGVFLIVVTAAVHVPGILVEPSWIPPDFQWMWVVLQRSNLVKNLCLLGVCFHLQHHEVGRFSLERWLKERVN
jgi:uncharacterized membrane protein YphA (DoxX/SURF4 family)